MSATLDELLTHRPPMRLLDRVIAVSENEVLAEISVDPSSPLFVPGCGMPAYVGVEMMAQAIATIDGMKRKTGGLPPKIGFLLGCRRYHVRSTYFAEHMILRISAKMVFSDGAMFSFECRIDDGDGAEIAAANMNVYAPADPQRFLQAGVP